MSERVRRSRRRNRIRISVFALILILVASVGVTTAYLVDKTDSVVNVFEAGNVSIEVEETFDDVTKSNVYIENTGDVSVYVRVALLPVWEDGNGNAVAETVNLESDLTITWGNSDKWKNGLDGFWYYTEAIAGNEKTDNLIDSAVVNTESVGYMNGYQMNLQVMAQAIQAEPDEAAEEAWKIVDADNGTLTVNQ